MLRAPARVTTFRIETMTIPTSVKIVEVGPRDGLQNEAQSVPTEIKIGLIEKLVDAGLPVVESGAFESPKWVPQMAASGEVFEGIKKRAHVAYPMLVPNLKGLEAALEAGVREIAGFAAATETFSQKNTNCSIKESLERFRQVSEKRAQKISKFEAIFPVYWVALTKARCLSISSPISQRNCSTRVVMKFHSVTPLASVRQLKRRP